MRVITIVQESILLETELLLEEKLYPLYISSIIYLFFMFAVIIILCYRIVVLLKGKNKKSNFFIGHFYPSE